uniref:Uncharacterized protein n=1 Tax=viral metagenome TaxID=1070528 RepID=A0A6M3IM83_9ZZZZ
MSETKICYMCGERIVPRWDTIPRSVTNRDVCTTCYVIVVEFVNNAHDESEGK